MHVRARLPLALLSTIALGSSVIAPVAAAGRPVAWPAHYGFGTAISVDVPAGSSASLLSPALPASSTTASIQIASALSGAAGLLQIVLPTISKDKRVLACAAIGTGALNPAAVQAYAQQSPITVPRAQLGVALTQLCLTLVQQLATMNRSVVKARESCAVATASLGLSVQPDGDNVVVSTDAQAAVGATPPVKVSCANAGTKTSVTVQTRTRAQRLATYLGPTVALGLQAPASAAQPTPVSVTFAKPR